MVDRTKHDLVTPSGSDGSVEQAVQWLLEKKAEMEQELTLFARQIGDYLLANFFDNDPQQVSSQNPNKSVSFRRLCERPDLPFTEGALRRFIQVSINFRLLPEKQATLLLPSHHSVLYQVADPQERRDIGIRAARDQVSVRKLRQMVRGKGRRKPGGGRKPDSAFSKNWRHLVAILESLADETEREGFLDSCRDSEIKGDCRRIRDMLTQIVDKVVDVSEGETITVEPADPTQNRQEQSNRRGEK